MPNFNTIRYNEELVGRLIISKMNGTDCIEDYNKDILIQSTVQPEQKFDSYREWLATIKEDARLMQRLKEKQEATRKIMDNNIEFHENWIQAKFNKCL